MKYTVTLELHTPWYIKVLRFLRLKKKREDFVLHLDTDFFEEGDMLVVSEGEKVLIISSYE